MKWIFKKIKVLFNKRQPQESIFNFLIRQFYFSDSNGKPSMHITILVFIMSMIGYMVIIESRVALSQVITQDPETKKILIGMKGFSSEFIYLMITLATIVTAFFSSRSKRNAIINNPTLSKFISSGKDKLNTVANITKSLFKGSESSEEKIEDEDITEVPKKIPKATIRKTK